MNNNEYEAPIQRGLLKPTLQITVFSILGIIVRFVTQIIVAAKFGATIERDGYFAAVVVPTYITAVLTDFHFAPTERTKENLVAEGIPEENIFVAGNTVIDALFITVEKLKRDKSMLQRLNSQFSFLNSKPTKLILITAHRRENLGEPLESICFALKEIVEANSEVKVIYLVHLNPSVQEPVKRILKDNERIHLINPLDYESFVWLMNKSYLILTDSGGIQEEAPSLGKPVLVLRQVTERPEAVKAGTVRVVGLDREKIVKEAQRLLDDQTLYEKMSKAVNPYGNGKASKRIVEVLRGVE